MKHTKKSVQSHLFQGTDFFMPHDRSQVKYEMLRAHCHDGQFIARVCREFGYSREAFYQALEAFPREGLPGLVDKPGRKKKPDKVTPEIIGYVIYQRAKFDLSGGAITQKVFEEFHHKLHKRTIERILGYSASSAARRGKLEQEPRILRPGKHHCGAQLQSLPACGGDDLAILANPKIRDLNSVGVLSKMAMLARRLCGGIVVPLKRVARFIIKVTLALRKQLFANLALPHDPFLPGPEVPPFIRDLILRE